MILSWESMLRTARASLGVIVLTILAVLVPPQTADMLAGNAHAMVMFHLGLFFMALSAWHWARTVLSARLQRQDTHEARRRTIPPPGSRMPERMVDAQALNLLPRFLYLAVALTGALAALRSGAWLQLLIVAVWTALGLCLLQYRLRIQKWLFDREDLSAGGRQWAAPSWLPRWMKGSWCSVAALLGHGPFGPWVAGGLLALSFVFFTAGLLESFFVASPSWPGFATLIGAALPGPAAVLVCLGLAIGPLTALTYDMDRLRLEGRAFGVPWRLRRPPVFFALLLLTLGTPLAVSLHGVRVMAEADQTITPAGRVSLQTYFDIWAERCAPGKGDIRPIIVAISGGASRAGLWGARVLRDVDAASASGGTAIFAISTVSGGSVGAATYLASLAGQDPGDAQTHAGPPCHLVSRGDGGKDAALAMGSADALGPLLAGAMFGDVPRALLGIPAFALHWVLGQVRDQDDLMRGGDRAEALERAFERNWDRALKNAALPVEAGTTLPLHAPFLSLFYTPQGPRGTVPLWIANGTDAQNGDRILTVPVGPEPWPFRSARDALWLLGRDVPISAAIDNTARFPFLSPAGELVSIGASSGKPLQVIDGGYFENEGLLTALELAEWLKANGPAGRRVQPIIVQATDAADVKANTVLEGERIRCGETPVADPTHPRGKSRIAEFLVPLIGLNNVRGAHSAVLLREARDRYCGTDGGPSFFHFYLYSDEDRDVPLNWVLSEKIADYIWNGAMKAGGNAEELDSLRHTLGDDAKRTASP